jgi:thiamine monophosphate kinase
VLAALTSDIVAASEAIVALGSEDEVRNVDLQDIQYGLSQLSWRYLVPDLGGDVVSKVLHTLVDAQEQLSTAELAERAGCSTRGMASEKNERVAVFNH